MFVLLFGFRLFHWLFRQTLFSFLDAHAPDRGNPGSLRQSTTRGFSHAASRDLCRLRSQSRRTLLRLDFGSAQMLLGLQIATRMRRQFRRLEAWSAQASAFCTITVNFLEHLS